MSGNVFEWCSDWYDTQYYSSSTRQNPKGPSSGSERVVRGGLWADAPWNIRSAKRRGIGPGNAGSILGFRLVLDLQILTNKKQDNLLAQTEQQKQAGDVVEDTSSSQQSFKLLREDQYPDGEFLEKMSKVPDKPKRIHQIFQINLQNESLLLVIALFEDGCAATKCWETYDFGIFKNDNSSYPLINQTDGLADVSRSVGVDTIVLLDDMFLV